MNSTIDKLAAAMRAVVTRHDAGGFVWPEVDRVRIALAEYDAAQGSAPVTYRADGREYVGQEWDNGPQVWDVVRDDGDQWICLADPEHSARVVAALNAAATAAPACPTLRDAVADDPTRALVLRAALEDYAKKQRAYLARHTGSATTRSDIAENDARRADAMIAELLVDVA